jgi:hypothetical protein
MAGQRVVAVVGGEGGEEKVLNHFPENVESFSKKFNQHFHENDLKKCWIHRLSIKNVGATLFLNKSRSTATS